MRICELGILSCVGGKSPRGEKKAVEGARATRIALWGRVLFTDQEIISIPDPKLKNAQELSAQPCFDPGVPGPHWASNRS